MRGLPGSGTLPQTLAHPLAPDGALLRRLAVLGATHGPDWLLRGAPPVLGPLFWALRREHRQGTRQNLRQILGPRSALDERLDELEVFTNFARSMAEGIASLGPRRTQARIDVRGSEHFLEQHGGCVLVTAHTSGFELAGALLAERLGREVVVVMQPEKNAGARQISDEVRQRGGLQVFLAQDGPTGALELAGCLRRGACVAIQADRVAPGGRSLSVSLWGQAAALPYGPFALARATGAPLLPVFTRRTGFLSVQVQIFPAISIPRRATEGEVGDAAQRVANLLESWISAHPTEWFDWGQGRAAG